MTLRTQVAEVLRSIGSRLAAAPGSLWVVLTALALVATYGIGFVFYDTMYSLVWGDQLRHGHVPDFEVPQAPTPHPLLNLIGALFSFFGEHAPSLEVVLATLAWGLLGWAAFSLGKALFSWPVGLVFALILVTRSFFAGQVLRCSLDVPFLALVVAAGAMHVRSPERPSRVLGVLTLAGLLRPDAWLLAAAYWILVARGAPNPVRLRLAAVAAAAPVIWAFHDLVITGDLLYSLHVTQESGTQEVGTQQIAGTLEIGTHEIEVTRSDPSGLDLAWQRLGGHMDVILGHQFVTAGLLGSLAALIFFPRRSLLPGVTAAIGLAVFFAVGVADVPVLPRYAELPAIPLALGCAVAIFGWVSLPRRSVLRVPWMVAGAVVLVVLVPKTYETVSGTRVASFSYFEERRKVERDLIDLGTEPLVKAASAQCQGPIHVQHFRLVPSVAYSLGVSPARLRWDPSPPRAGLVVLARSPATIDLYLFGDPLPSDSLPPGFRPVARNASWAAYARC